jgi:YopT peptidase
MWVLEDGEMGIASYVLFRTARNSLDRFGGVMTWDFSQMNLNVYQIIRRDAASAGGICKALAAQWIVDHAYGGSLYNRVVDQRGNLNLAAIRMIMQNFIIGSGQQVTATAQFMLKRGVLERQSSQDISRTIVRRVDGRRVDVPTVTHTTKATYQANVGAPTCNVAVELPQALRRVVDGYALIDFGAMTGDGHSTAAWIGVKRPDVAGDVCFFDPNVGEFYFRDKENFFRWFQVFYAACYQGFPCNFNGRWAVGQWALANGAAREAYARAVLSVAGAR